jgi:hypothetical protein
MGEKGAYPIKTGLWELPWRGRMVPHGVLDILRGCNISCRACYNEIPPACPKPLGVIREELETLMKLRRLSSVSILGGEVTLHPQLYEIVRMVHEHGIRTELLTNGLDVEASVCRELKKSGLDILYFHIERGQRRPDLPVEHSATDLDALRREKAALAAGEGLDVGLTLTAYPGEFEEVEDIVSLTIGTPGIHYLLVTLMRDHTGVNYLHGDIVRGFTGSGTPPSEAAVQHGAFVMNRMRSAFGFEPFAYLGSNFDGDDPRWLSYLIGVVYGPGGGFRAAHVRPGLLEKACMAGYRLAGRYPMYLEQNAGLFRKHLFLNGLLRGRRESSAALAREARKPGARLAAKRILFQNPAELTRDGRLIHCKGCPDAVLKNGSLVPVCIADVVT